MRPEILNSLFAPITTVPGVGPRISKLIETSVGLHVVDLILHRPSGLIDRRYAPKMSEAKTGIIATLTVTVEEHVPPRIRRLPYKIICSDETGSISLVFFHARETYLKQVLPEGETRVVSGTIEAYGNKLQMTHPDHIGTLQELDRLQAVEPVYPLTQGLSLKILSKAIRSAVNSAPDLPEWQDPSYVQRQNWPTWKNAVLTLHSPKTNSHLKPTATALRRLAYDEILANQLALALARNHMRRNSGRIIKSSGILRSKLEKALPFTLTGSQLAAVEEITLDMSSSSRMHRLLQGDVGSGKTVVALLSMLSAIESGNQAALLAPTEILAHQHFATMEPLAKSVGIRLALYTGRDRSKGRASKLANLASGETQLIIGTHTLFQEGVKFKDLAFVVIDEQHRFGVHQRMALAEKGQSVDLLVMTATPIPRTLTLTAYGDMDISQLKEKPANRLPVDTRTISIDRLNEVVSAIQRALSSGAKIYWICPLIDESQVLDLAAAEDRYAHLKSKFGARVGLLHGKMKGQEKDTVMKNFAANDVDILVATTVVEVGIDVPEATVMVIEHAERFGLTQLHQLRGRIGRGLDKSTCLLLYAKNLTTQARERLNILRDTEDGFCIAEEDLRLRGAGDLLGTRQSGLPAFKLVDFREHGDLLQAARDDAELIIENDPNLSTDRGQQLRLLLYLFAQDTGVKFLQKG